MFQLASGYSGGGAFEVAAIALNFYLLGRHSQGRSRARVSAAVFAYWLAGVVVITYDQPGASVGAVLGAWVLLGGLPYALGGRSRVAAVWRANSRRGWRGWMTTMRSARSGPPAKSAIGWRVSSTT